MRFLLPRLAIIFMLYVVSFTYKINDGTYINVHENTISPLKPLPPQDPAIHLFPTAPTVPLVPICVEPGYLRDPFNCKKFYYCPYANAVPGGFYCQASLIFNTVTNSCEPPEHVAC